MSLRASFFAVIASGTERPAGSGVERGNPVFHAVIASDSLSVPSNTGQGNEE
ncbi:hypothetical protein KKD20_05480 [Patescibacteria group bacterium]|nr:hypothetical protein [Patescibacteria group bacterium]